ncbi:MAG TPA: hypothetical protein VFN75_00745 [Pseudonocardiaceae bacterium]|nr:hypothetical protein [Pseudonocardiaceae bacterium]
MTTLQDTMTDAARRGREAFAGALRIWADSVDKFAPTSDARWHGAVETVDTMFDFTEHMLTSQREFTKVWLAATTSAATKAAVAAQHAAEDMQDVAKETALTRDMQDVDKETAPTRDMRDGAKTPAPRKS